MSTAYDPKAAAAALEAAGAMLKGVTEGPWLAKDLHGEEMVLLGTPAPWRKRLDAHGTFLKSDARFIAYAREGVPAIAAHLTAAMAEVERLSDQVRLLTEDSEAMGKMVRAIESLTPPPDAHEVWKHGFTVAQMAIVKMMHARALLADGER